MAEMLVKSESLVAIADKIRVLSGTTNTLGLDAMATNVGDANTEVDSQTDLIAQIQTALQGKASAGGAAEPVLQSKTVTPSTSTQNITPDSGYDGLSQVTVNAMPTATQATPSISVNSSGLITASSTQTAGYVSAGTKSATKQLTTQEAQTITPSTSDKTIESGRYLTGTQTIKGDSNLVAGNIKSGVSIFGVNGTYAGSGGGSGGDTSGEDGVIARTLTSYTNDRVTTIGDGAFAYASNLKSVSFPAATTIGNSAFYSCSSLTTVSFPAATTIGSSAFYCCSFLTTVNFPAATTIGSSAFYYCSHLTTVNFPAATTIESAAFYFCFSLTTVSFPAVTTIGSSALRSCSSLTTVSFPAATTIGSSAFRSCCNLKSLYLTGSSLCKLYNSNAFTSTPIGGYSTSAGTYGSIYVPTSLLTSYQTATNWTYFSSRFVGI